MKENSNDIFTPAVKKHIETVARGLGLRFCLDPLRRAEVENNIMKYLWRNAHYYNPRLSEWDTFASLVVTSGAKRESVRLTKEAKVA